MPYSAAERIGGPEFQTEVPGRWRAICLIHRHSALFITEELEMAMSDTLTAASHGVSPHQHEEGTITKAIEHYTSQVPSGTYLSLALGSIGLSLGLQLLGHKHAANFVGQWVPTILILGLYNKLVKIEGSE
jgi:hypothetical protein